MSTMTLFDGLDEAETRPQKWVTVSNDMVMARMDWDIMMHRIMMVLVSQIDSKHDDKFRLQRVRVRDIRDMAQVSQKSIHREAAEAASKLVRQPIEFWSDDKQDYEGYPIFSVCKYKSREGVIEAKFNDDARIFLLQLSERFTQYRLKQAIPLSTPYAIRTYEISKMVERPGEKRIQEIPVTRFRQMFKLEDKYARHSDMRRRVINPSIEEVNEKCDVDAECTDVRVGQTPVALEWKVASSSVRERGRLVGAATKKNRRVASASECRGSTLPGSGRGGKRAGGDDSELPYRKWFDNLGLDERKTVTERARERALNDGYSPSMKRSFEAGMEMKLSAIFREENEGVSTKD